MRTWDYQIIFEDGAPSMDVLPTPALLEAASGPRFVEAYQTSGPSGSYPAMWRLRDDSYDPPGTGYRRIKIRRVTA